MRLERSSRVAEERSSLDEGAEAVLLCVPASKALVPRKPFDMTVNDRRFLRSLRIAAEEVKVEETN